MNKQNQQILRNMFPLGGGQKPFQIGFLLGKIECQNCKQAFMPDGINTFLSLDDVFSAAVKAHNAAVFTTKTLCSTPKIIVFYATVLIDKSLVLNAQTPETQIQKPM